MRRRRWLRRLGGSALALLALVTLRIILGKSLGGWVAARERARFESEIGPLDPARLAAPELADGENAAAAIAAAVARLGVGEAELASLAAATPPKGTDADLPALDRLLAERDGRLNELAAAASLPRSSFGPRPLLFSSEGLAGIEWLHAARLVAGDGLRALAAGDEDRLERAQRTLLGMSLALRREPIVVFSLFGIATETLYLDLLRQRLASGIEARALEALGGQIGSLRRLPDARAVLHGEGVFAYAMLRRQLPAATPPRGLVERIESVVWPWSEGHVEAGALEGWRELAVYATKPQALWPDAPAWIRSRHGRMRRWLDPTVPYETLRTALVPNLLVAARKLQFLAAAEQLAALALDVAREAEASGALPSDLVGFVDAETLDPVAAERPSYRLSADGATIELVAAHALARDILVDGMPPAATGARRLAGLLGWRLKPAKRAATHAAPEPTAEGSAR